MDSARRYAFRHGVILANAPRASGIFALFKKKQLLYLGEANSIFAGLMNYLDRLDGEEFEYPSAFSFEACAPEHRRLRLTQLIFKYRPRYNPDHPELNSRES